MAEPSATSERLAAKVAEATQQYALKNYTAAADHYSEASILQAEINGEMAPENAELLYAYGRCLFHVAVGKSDVLGGKVVGTGTGGDKPRGKKRKIAASDTTVNVANAARQKDGANKGDLTAPQKEGPKPYFQIEGDDKDWESDGSDGKNVGSDGESAKQDDAGQEGDEEDEEEDEDDFGIAYEILDIARVLFIRKIEGKDSISTPNTNNGAKQAKPINGIDKGAEATTGRQPPEVRRLQELLADTYDLQSEISLENERFTDATMDAKASLALKTALYPKDSSIIAEAHFKVSLALEFGAKTTMEKTDELDGGGREEVEGVDEEMRKESAKHMQLAIESTKLRMEREKSELGTCKDAQDKEKRRRVIEDVREMIADMEQRLQDLRAPTIPLSVAALADPLNPASSAGSDAAPLRGILSSLLGETPASQRAQLEAATKNATDLTNMIRHKKKEREVGAASIRDANGSKEANEAAAVDTATRSKRKAITEENGSKESTKRARVAIVEETDELA